MSLAFVHSRSYTGRTVALTRGWPVVAVTDPSPAAAVGLLTTHAPSVVEAPPNVLMSWEEPARPLSRRLTRSPASEALSTWRTCCSSVSPT